MNGVNSPFGLQPIRLQDGSAYTGGGTAYIIASAYGTSLFSGDPVTTLSDGSIGIGVAGSAIRGVFDHCEYQPATGQPYYGYWLAGSTAKSGTTIIAYVHDNPNLVFQVQESDGSGNAGTPLALADVNLNANFYVGTGNGSINPEGQSGTTINNATEDVTATLNLKILGLAPFAPSINPVGNFAVWEVVINNHQLKGGTGTLGT